ncbi:hypothetical protein BMS3Abin03_00772 [bacterium BMS3Abin03]|nr:hypothetical protein BMS3Abin03_00772 [bacterium BMS3Abin03]
MLLFNKHIKTFSTWLLVLSLSTHFFSFHGIFESLVLCFEEDGSTNIEYSIDGETCIAHYNQLIEDIISSDTVEENNCEDISFSESNHNDDRFVVKKFNKPISNTDLIFSSPVKLPAEKYFTKVFNNFSTIQSNSIQQLKTVLLLI